MPCAGPRHCQVGEERNALGLPQQRVYFSTVTSGEADSSKHPKHMHTSPRYASVRFPPPDNAIVALNPATHSHFVFDILVAELLLEVALFAQNHAAVHHEQHERKQK